VTEVKRSDFSALELKSCTHVTIIKSHQGHLSESVRELVGALTPKQPTETKVQLLVLETCNFPDGSGLGCVVPDYERIEHAGDKTLPLCVAFWTSACFAAYAKAQHDLAALRQTTPGHAVTAPHPARLPSSVDECFRIFGRLLSSATSSQLGTTALLGQLSNYMTSLLHSLVDALLAQCPDVLLRP
jgi:hypothetical protein